ncbi:MAG TPA: hypothetical protein VK060_00070 [Ruania sp.]|nr:hypothetical protein [Ruania sp.]
MLRRILAIVLIVLGLGTAGAAVASGTIWRPSEEVTATLPQDPDVPVVVAGGNVLATVNPNVTVTLTAPDSETPLVLAMGREADVRAWLDGSPYQEITGLTDWETLAVEEGAAASEEPSEDASASEEPSEDASASEEATEDASATEESSEDASGDEQAEDSSADATVPDPAGSDLWIEEITGTGELTYDWSQVEGRWLMLVATDGTEPAPDVSMTWTREVTTPLVVPGLIVGGVLFLIGLVWLIVELLVHREERRARRARSASSADEAAPAVATTAEDGTPLTRREIREAARAAARKGGATSAPTAAESSAEEAASSADSAASPDQPEGAPSDWNAIISGAPAEQKTAEEDRLVDTPDQPEPDRSGAAETSSDTASAESGATDLDEWVRQGRTGDQAGPVSTYESPAPGRGLGSEPAGDLGRSWQGTPGSGDTTATEADAVDTPAEPAGKPRRWWQRRRREDAGATGPGAAEGAGTAPERTPEPTGDSDAGAGQASTAVDEPNPQASGASWRQTWGLSGTVTSPQPPDEDNEQPEADPARTDTDPAADAAADPADTARGDEEGDR